MKKPKPKSLMREVTRVARERGVSLREALATDERVRGLIEGGDLDTLLDPARALGVADVLIERALGALREASEAGTES